MPRRFDYVRLDAEAGQAVARDACDTADVGAVRRVGRYGRDGDPFGQPALEIGPMRVGDGA
jgi:hypothetical protein